MKRQMTFSQAVAGYTMAAEARRLSSHTLADYTVTFRKFADFLGEDREIASIRPQEVMEFLAHQPVSKKTILNYHIGLSALWTWAGNEELVPEHIMRRVERAKPEKRAINPYSEGDLRAMLSALTTSRLYSRPGKRETVHSLRTTERMRAMILLLLDTGIRASEICELRIHQLDLRNRRITVFGKGSKERTLPFSSRTGTALFKYLATRREDTSGDYLFVSEIGGPLDRSDLLKALWMLGERAGVSDVTVHRFRHTFAINYLRNGGDAYSLQMMLGHTTMEMVRTYLSLAQADLEKAHKIASPVDHWRL